MTITSKDFVSQMAAFNHEPTRAMAYMTSIQERLHDGEELYVDPSTPAVEIMEMMALQTWGAIQRAEILDYRSYPNMAQTAEQLTYHKSDRDYVGDFTTPGGAWFDIYVSEDELIAKSVRIGETKTRKLTFPKHSYILVNGLTFTFQYPINVIVKSHNGIDIVYDVSRPSPLQQMSGNVVDWGVVTTPLATDTNGRIRMVWMRVYLRQMTLSSSQHSVSDAKILRKTFDLADPFFYVRAFNRNNGAWVEMKTTNSQQTFDPNDPTLLYTLVDNQLTIELPYVYTKQTLVNDSIRVDIYTTKGPINLDFDGLTPNDFRVTWNDLDKDDSAQFYSPLGSMSTISVFSTDIASGGAAAPSFETQRERVKNNAVGDPVIPISNAQLGVELEQMGFDTDTKIDDFTALTYLASRAMPVDINGRASTGVDCAVITLKTTLTDLVKYKTVLDNGNRVTLTPKTLYQYTDGILNIVPDGQREAIDLLEGDAKVNKINGQHYMWTPLHYVFDYNEDKFAARPYYLDNPKFGVASYVASNDSLGLTISASKVRSIVRDDKGYQIDILCSSNDTWKELKDEQVHVQLAFQPLEESTMAYINGEQITIDPASKERLFRFRIDTNWDIDKAHALITSNFAMFEAVRRDFATPLETNFTLIWAVSDYTVDGSEQSDVDLVLGKFLLPKTAVGVYLEELNVHMGDELSGLWSRCRSMISNRKYLTYDKDVYKVYEENEYARDPATNQFILEVGADGKKKLKLVHAKGDIQYHEDGVTPVVEHEAGAAMVDENGNLIMESDRNIQRWVDLTLLDGVYRYATAAADIVYRQNVPGFLVEWINDQLGGLKPQLLANTELFFQPRTTIRYVETRVEDGELMTLHSAQRLTIDLYVTDDVYKDTELREALKASAIAQVVKGLDSVTVARNVVEKGITDNLGTDIIGVHLSGLGGLENDFNVIVLLDETTRLGLAKALETTADGKYAVVDAIEVDFKRNDALAT